MRQGFLLLLRILYLIVNTKEAPPGTPAREFGVGRGRLSDVENQRWQAGHQTVVRWARRPLESAEPQTGHGSPARP